MKDSKSIVRWLVILAGIGAAGFIAYKIYQQVKITMAAKTVSSVTDEVLRIAQN
jgi:hypothetical protein